VIDVLAASATDAEYNHNHITVSARHFAVGSRHIAVVLTLSVAYINDDDLRLSLFIRHNNGS